MRQHAEDRKTEGIGATTWNKYRNQSISSSAHFSRINERRIAHGDISSAVRRFNCMLP